MLRFLSRTTLLRPVPRYAHRPFSSIHHRPTRASLDILNYRPIQGLSLRRSFHATPSRHGAPLLPIMLALLKSSTALEVARTVSRIVLTFVPFIWLKNKRARHIIKHGDWSGNPATEERKLLLTERIKKRTWFFHIALSLPVLLFWATLLASLERTPLTGRWRLIALSPEEEEEIAAELAGPGWYEAVGRILAEDGTPRFVPPSDWRYQWVLDTLRNLEHSIPALVQESKQSQEWLDPTSHPLPPPSDYPLRPRPRASEYLRHMCERMCERQANPAPHSIPGPPYSLLVVDKPDSSNAFSYGFGPDGGGGIVVYSGFLDDLLSRTPNHHPTAEDSWSSSLFGLFSSSAPRRPTPTSEQTADLAILLSHELAHLILSHHLETLSSATVLLPGTLSILSDLIRVVIFPITAIFGPFVNDAVAQLGKIGSGELMKVGEYCTSVKQEIEADVVSARLLAYSGFDARHAISFWEQRTASECSHADGIELTPARQIMGNSHPVNQDRVEGLKGEITRWETERRAAIHRLKRPPRESRILLAAA